jgi:sugar lactone lactonase YvrE
MNIAIRLSTMALAALSLALCGCSGMEQASFPNVPAQNTIGSIQGSVLGGHAPITGSHIFLLEATSTGYAAKARSLLTSSSTATSGTYPVAEDLTTGSVTNGLYYVTSDSNGAFNITGDYTCDVGYPVYLYAAGGAPGASTVLSISAISDTVSGGTTTYTFTAANLLSTGQTVQFSSSSLGGEWATLNGTTQTVLATPTTTSFRVSTTIAPGTGANTATGSVTATGPANPAMSNLAMLGLCPGSGNFTNSLRYVYMNEVATVAMAYAFSGFATDGLHIGTSSTNLIGLQNATLNAANLYNIQGGPLELAGNSSQGEGQIANQTTIAGNGTVPQAELNTLANILASCVDSSDTASTPSATCTTLFADATSTGTTSGVKPIDVATAAINITNNPGTPNVVALWELSSGAVPFSPQLTAAPRDFSVAITYTNISAPGSIAIDASGNAYVPTNSTSSYVTKLSPQGAVLATSATGGSGFNSIAVAPNGNVYVAAKASNAVYEYTSTLGAVTGSPLNSPAMNAPTSVIVDSSGNVYVTDGAGSLIRKFNSAGAFSASITNSCLAGVSEIAIDPPGYLWTVSYANSDGCRVSNPGGTSTFDLGGSVLEPGNMAIDSNGKGWAPLKSANQLAGVTPTGSGSLYAGSTVGGLASPTWIAIDGASNLWVTNAGNSYALTELTNTATAISGTSGYQGGVLNNPSFLAIDASGDVWVPNLSGNSVTELIGVATPLVTPLSALQSGVRP